MAGRSKITGYFFHGARFVAAIILMQTLFYKFAAGLVIPFFEVRIPEESIHIFSDLGAEPWGRWGAGFAELIGSILLLIPRFSYLGAIMGLGLMSGAIVAHWAVLGLSVEMDGGLLFELALIVFSLCTYILFHEKEKILCLLKRLTGSKSPA
ncbi:MAG: DoxX family protein [Cytophagales bacterium]|nr:DoxX family protein [Cytophagales bacterium]